jgi:hypothetical protein
MLDKNTLIGFSLILALLVGWAYFLKPSDEEIEAYKRQQDSTNIAAIQQDSIVRTSIDSLKNNAVLSASTDTAIANETFGTFAKAAQGTEEFSSIENNDLKITFTNKGGRIYKVQLKKYKTYTQQDLVLFDGAENVQSFDFPTVDNKIINTSNLYFKSTISEDKKSISMKVSIGENQYIGGMLRHQSSQGGIKNVPLDDKFSNTGLDLVYGNKQQNYAWKTDLGYQRQCFNWYGLPEDYGSTLAPTDLQNLINGINPKHIYQNLSLGGKISFNEGVFKEMGLKFNQFWDSYGSTENRFYAKPTFDFDIMESKIRTNILVDYVGGNFKNSVFSTKYGFVNLGLNPNYVLAKDDLSVNLGVNLFFSADNENTKNKFFIYCQKLH